MPLRRKYLSELLKGTSTFEETTGNNFNFHRVTVAGNGSTDVDISTVGTILAWVVADTEWVVAGNATTIAALGTSNLPDGAPLCVVVGPKEGRGMAPGTVTIDAEDGVEVSVIFRGPATLVREGLEYDAQSITTGAAAIEKALERQGISISESATEVVPSYVSF